MLSSSAVHSLPCFSQVLFGQHFHSSAVVMAYLIDEFSFIINNDQREKDHHHQKNENSSYSSSVLLAMTSLDAQARFVDSVLKSSKRMSLALVKNREYVSSVAKAYVKWLEETFNNYKENEKEKGKEDDGEDEEEDSEVLEFDDELMEFVTGTTPFTADENDDDTNNDEYKTLTFYDAFNQQIFANVGPQFVNVGLSLWPASALLSKFIVDRIYVATTENKETRHNLVFLELGSGIGLTGIYFEKALPSLALKNTKSNDDDTDPSTSKSNFVHNHRFIMTDYQDVILDLGNANLKLNRHHESKRVQQCSEYRNLHWGELEQNEKFFHDILKETSASLIASTADEKAAECKNNNHQKSDETVVVPTTTTEFIICAADVLYDPTLVEFLVDTIDGALKTLASASTMSSFGVTCNRKLTTKINSRVIIYHTVRNPATFELFQEKATAKGMKVEVFEIKEDTEDNMTHVDADLNKKIGQMITQLQKRGENNSNDDMKKKMKDDKDEQRDNDDENKKSMPNSSSSTTTLLRPFMKTEVQCENIIRSLQDGRFYNGIFAKMAQQLRRVEVTMK